MCKQKFLKFYELLDEYDDTNYIFGLLRFLTSPTKSKLKVGTLVNLKNSKRRLKDIWCSNRECIMREVDLKYLELKIEENSVLIYFYSEDLLEDLLGDGKIKKVLKDFEYVNYNCVVNCLNCLKHRVQTLEVFPNEIGIFLGYPLEDVMDFHCKDKLCKLNGYWKCYNDVNSSRNAFESFDREKLRVVNEYLRGAI